MVYWIKRKWNQIKRVFDFLPIIWNSYDFDYRYSIDIFKKSLERQADYMESNNSHTLNSKQTASRIRTAIKLMEKVYEDEYSTAYLDDLQEMYGKSFFNFKPTDQVDENGDPYYTIEITYENAKDDNHNKEINEMSNKMMLKANDKQKRAHKLLWDFIEHNIQNFWD